MKKQIQWKRNCPQCNKIIMHKNKSSYQYSINHNRICLSCAHIGQIYTPMPKETRERMSKCRSGKNNPFYGKKHTKETIEIIRQTSIERRRNRKYQFVSKSATYFLDLIEKTFNIKFDEREFEINRYYYDAIYGKNIFEIDGGYWHSLPKTIERDKYKEKLAKQNGYNIYRFTVNEISEVDEKFNKYKNKLYEIINKK